MIRKHILNGLTLALMLTLIPTPAHAGWFSTGLLSWISNYFNQPSKNALIATTAIAELSLLSAVTALWYFRSLGNLFKKQTHHLAYVEGERDKLEAECDILKKANAKLKHEKIVFARKAMYGKNKALRAKARVRARHSRAESPSYSVPFSAGLTPDAAHTTNRAFMLAAAPTQYQGASFAGAHDQNSPHYSASTASTHEQRPPVDHDAFGSQILGQAQN